MVRSRLSRALLGAAVHDDSGSERAEPHPAMSNRDTGAGGSMDALRYARHRFDTVIARGVMVALILLGVSASSGRAADQVYFTALTNVTDLLIQRINAETARVDISAWYLTEHAISIAIANKFHSGVPVRLIGDRGSIFEIDANT